MIIEMTQKDGSKVLINTKLVRYIIQARDGTASINYSSNDFFSVKEMYGDIKELLGAS